MQISARNQLQGTVQSITRGEAIANVVLDVAGQRRRVRLEHARDRPVEAGQPAQPGELADDPTGVPVGGAPAPPVRESLPLAPRAMTAYQRFEPSSSASLAVIESTTMRVGRSSLPLFTPSTWSGPSWPFTRTVNSLG